MEIHMTGLASVNGFRVGDMVEVRRPGRWVAAKVVSFTVYHIVVVLEENQAVMKVSNRGSTGVGIRVYVPSRVLHDKHRSEV